jgi:hypothetical protein
MGNRRTMPKSFSGRYFEYLKTAIHFGQIEAAHGIPVNAERL